MSLGLPFNTRSLFEFTGPRVVFDVKGQIVAFEHDDGSVDTFEGVVGKLGAMNEQAKADAFARADVNHERWLRYRRAIEEEEE